MSHLYDQDRDAARPEPRGSSGLPARLPSRLMPTSGRGTRYRRRRRRFLRPGRLLLGAALVVAALFLWKNLSLGTSSDRPDTGENPSGSSLPAGSVSNSSIAAPAPTGNNEAEITPPRWVTQDLLPLNAYSRPGDPLPQVNGVVVHYVGNPGTTAEQNRSYYANLAETHETYVSSHFLIGMDGTILQCVPLNEISYCSNDRNGDTIAIECCHPDETGQFTQETTRSLTRLLNWLIETYDLGREDILRHYDVTGKECPRYFVRHPEEWEAFLDTLTFPAR